LNRAAARNIDSYPLAKCATHGVFSTQIYHASIPILILPFFVAAKRITIPYYVRILSYTLTGKDAGENTDTFNKMAILSDLESL